MKYEMVYIDPVEIKPANYNPRAITEEAKSGLAESIETFGLVGPLIINTRTGNLISGHQRLTIALEKMYKEVPVIYVDLDEAQEKLLNVTLNNQKITGYFTEDLNAILGTIRTTLSPELYEKVRLSGLENHIIASEWTSDIKKIDKVQEEIERSKKRIFIDCPADLYDEVMIFIKGKFLETSFEGVHVR